MEADNRESGEYLINIDLRSRTPIYEQIIEKMKEQIILGALEADEQLPSVREMAASLAINPNTIQRAYRKLEEEGFIYSVRGRGSFVLKLNAALLNQQKENWFQKLQELLAEGKKIQITRAECLEIIEKAYKKQGGN